jgi:hypothetical protein
VWRLRLAAVLVAVSALWLVSPVSAVVPAGSRSFYVFRCIRGVSCPACTLYQRRANVTVVLESGWGATGSPAEPTYFEAATQCPTVAREFAAYGLRSPRDFWRYTSGKRPPLNMALGRTLRIVCTAGATDGEQMVVYDSGSETYGDGVCRYLEATSDLTVR